MRDLYANLTGAKIDKEGFRPRQGNEGFVLMQAVINKILKDRFRPRQGNEGFVFAGAACACITVVSCFRPRQGNEGFV